MVMSIYTLTDAVVIGKGVGPNALAALSITTPLLCISLLRNVILSSAAILIFPVLFGGNSLWLGMPVVEVAVLIVSILFLVQKCAIFFLLDCTMCLKKSYV